jgi:hypothetical protein
MAQRSEPRRLLQPLADRNVGNIQSLRDRVDVASPAVVMAEIDALVALDKTIIPTLAELEALKPKHGAKQALPGALPREEATVRSTGSLLRVAPPPHKSLKKKDLLTRVSSSETFAKINAALTTGENPELLRTEAKLLAGLGLGKSGGGKLGTLMTSASSPLLPSRGAILGSSASNPNLAPPSSAGLQRTATPQTRKGGGTAASAGTNDDSVLLDKLLAEYPKEDEELAAVMRMVGLDKSAQKETQAIKPQGRDSARKEEEKAAMLAELTVNTTRSEDSTDANERAADQSRKFQSPGARSPFLVSPWGMGLQRQIDEEKEKKRQEELKLEEVRKDTKGGFRSSTTPHSSSGSHQRPFSHASTSTAARGGEDQFKGMLSPAAATRAVGTANSLALPSVKKAAVGALAVAAASSPFGTHKGSKPDNAIEAVSDSTPPSAAPPAKNYDHIVEKWVPAEEAIRGILGANAVSEAADDAGLASNNEFSRELRISAGNGNVSDPSLASVTLASELLELPGVASKALETLKRRHPKVFGVSSAAEKDAAQARLKLKGVTVEAEEDPWKAFSSPATNTKITVSGRTSGPISASSKSTTKKAKLKPLSADKGGATAIIAFSSPFDYHSEERLMEKAALGGSAKDGQRATLRRLRLPGQPSSALDGELEEPSSLLVDGLYTRKIAADRGMGLLLSFETAADYIRQGGHLEGLSSEVPVYILDADVDVGAPSKEVEEGEERQQGQRFRSVEQQLSDYLAWRREAATTNKH